MKKIKKGDTVKILLGKDRGKSGKVVRVLPKKDQIVVEGVNISKRHVKKTAQSQGGIVEIVKPLHISNVALICPNCGGRSRIGFKVTDLGKARMCKKCGQVIENKREDKK